MTATPLIDCLQYSAWSEPIFQQMRAGGVAAVHVTVAYHETFREMVANLAAWDRRFQAFPSLIRRAGSAAEVLEAQREGRTAILFGFQNPSPIEDDIGLETRLGHEATVNANGLNDSAHNLDATCIPNTEVRVGRGTLRASSSSRRA